MEGLVGCGKNCSFFRSEVGAMEEFRAEEGWVLTKVFMASLWLGMENELGGGSGQRGSWETGEEATIMGHVRDDGGLALGMEVREVVRCWVWSVPSHPWSCLHLPTALTFAGTFIAI